jgi:hypothetical protein
MSDEMKFFIYLLESYALEKGISGKQVLNVWKSKNIVNYIVDMYFMYHQERLENAFDDIDRLILEKTG